MDMLFAAAALVSTLAMIALAVWIRARARELRGDKDRAWLYEHGRPAVAVLLSLENLNESLNDDPVARAHVRFTPTDGSDPVEGTRDLFVSMLTVPWIGDRLPALHDRSDPNRFVIITEVGEDTPARVRELHRAIRKERHPPGPIPGPRPNSDLIDVVARLGRIKQDRQTGELSRRKASSQSTDLLRAHFNLSSD